MDRRRRSGDRRSHRPTDEISATGARYAARNALVGEARRSTGRNVPHQEHRVQARRLVRAAKEGALDAQDRTERAAR